MKKRPRKKRLIPRRLLRDLRWLSKSVEDRGYAPDRLLLGQRDAHTILSALAALGYDEEENGSPMGQRNEARSLAAQWRTRHLGGPPERDIDLFPWERE